MLRREIAKAIATSMAFTLFVILVISGPDPYTRDLKRIRFLQQETRAARIEMARSTQLTLMAMPTSTPTPTPTGTPTATPDYGAPVAQW